MKLQKINSRLYKNDDETIVIGLVNWMGKKLWSVQMKDLQGKVKTKGFVSLKNAKEFAENVSTN